MWDDLFGGCGGVATGMWLLGVDEVGFEWEADACATRAAAGHRTIRADLATYPPQACEGLWASPPCPSFSVAGLGAGKLVMSLIERASTDAAEGRDWRWRVAEAERELLSRVAARDDIDAYCATQAEISFLSVVALEWITHARPRWVAFENVKEIEPVWRHQAHLLADLGYYTWVGILNAADYGVPQTRRRCILMASLDGPVGPPPPTHGREAGGLLGLRPWRSMAEALGVDGSIGFGRRDDVGTSPDGLRERDFRPADLPAFNIGEKARSWVIRTGANSMKHDRDPDNVVRYERPMDEPAPTLDPKASGAWKMRHSVGEPGEDSWTDHRVGLDEPSPTVDTKARAWQLQPGAWADGRGGNGRLYEPDEPAPSVVFGHDAAAWVFTMPATSVAADYRVTSRAHHGMDGSQGANPISLDEIAAGEDPGLRPIRLEPWMALALQSFPLGYPTQGSRTSQFRQIGNAVPCFLAAAVVGELMGLPWRDAIDSVLPT